MKHGTIIIFILSILLTVVSLTSNGAKRFVQQGGNGTGTGSWGNANGNLYQIILQSQPGDTIWVARGTYKPTTSTDRTFSFFLKQGVVMLGGFLGNENYLTERDVAAHPTILDGDIDNAGNNDCYHVLRKYTQNPLLTAATVLDGFIVRNGKADDLNVASHSMGGAMYLENSSPTISNCTFISNFAWYGGGAIYSINSSPSFFNCDFSNNNSFNFAGAFYLKGNGVLTIAGCNFLNNTSEYVAVLYVLDKPQVNISGSVFKDNSAHFSAALSFETSSSKNRIDNCIFINNTLIENRFVSTIYDPNEMTISNCNFYSNSINIGGRLVEVDGNANVFNCIFKGYDNMIVSSATTKIYNSIIQGGVTTCTDCPGGNGNVDPLFSDISDLDGADNILGTADDGMRLTAYSQGIDAGIDSVFTYPDITGAPRSGGDGIDIGAYEGAVCIEAASNRLYVDAAVAGGNRSGNSWENAFKDLQTAIHVAKICTGVSEIWVAKGTYKPTATKQPSRYFTMVNGVKIYGGFRGDETLLTQRNHRKNITTLSGNIDEAGTADSYSIIRNTDLNNTAQLDGFTITGANNKLAGSGGAIYNNNASAVFSNCVIKNNTAGPAQGGGMFNNSHSNPEILNCVFANNAAAYGGGIFNLSISSPVLRNCILVNNNASGNGGGMQSSIACNPTLINCNIIANTAAGSGAGIFNQLTASPVITNCILWGNGGAGKELVNANGTCVPVVSYSYVQGGYTPCTSCADNSTSPQFFKDFNWAGADSVYGTVDDEMHLYPPSPCLNSGNNAVVADSFDIAGQPRIQDGTVNIGAYENMYLVTLSNGNWNTASNWNLQRVPLASDRVYIKNGHVITLDQPGGACKSILVQPGAKLKIVLPGALQVK